MSVKTIIQNGVIPRRVERARQRLVGPARASTAFNLDRAVAAAGPRRQGRYHAPNAWSVLMTAPIPAHQQSDADAGAPQARWNLRR